MGPTGHDRELREYWSLVPGSDSSIPGRGCFLDISMPGIDHRFQDRAIRRFDFKMPQSPNAGSSKRSRNCTRSPRRLPGKQFHVTRLTIIKSLCQSQKPPQPSLCSWLRKFRARCDKRNTQTFRELVDRAVKELKPYSADPTEERKARLSSLCREMKAEQNEYKKIGWNMVRLLKSRNLVVVEQCLRSVLRTAEAPYWAYHAARDYAVATTLNIVRTDPKFRTDGRRDRRILAGLFWDQGMKVLRRTRETLV